jgi:DNA-binding transcriptional ArsR family regulator
MTKKSTQQTPFMPISTLSEAADCLRLMAHPIRLRIVEILMSGDYTVGQIAEMCGLPHNQTCEHLRLMKGHGFLVGERSGRTVIYRIANPRLPALLQCIRGTCQGFSEEQSTSNT